MNRKLSVKGDAVSWSFFVNGPAYTSKRSSPEFVMMMFGIEARVLLMESATGSACETKRLRRLPLEGKGSRLSVKSCGAVPKRKLRSKFFESCSRPCVIDRPESVSNVALFRPEWN